MNDIVNGIYESWFSKDYPKEWKISRIKELISEIRKEKNRVEDTPVISLTINGVKIKNNLSEGMNPETYIGHQLVYPGDLVICLRDLDGPLLVGISEHYGCTSNLYVVLQLDNHNLDYYNYVFKTMDFLRVIDDFSYGMRHSYNISQFSQLRLPAPQLLIQNKIVQKLLLLEQKIDQLIKNQLQQIEKLKEYKQSLISGVVTKGLDPNVEFKDSGIEWIRKIPSRWDMIRVKDLSINTTSRNEDENLQYIALENIISQSFDFIDSDNDYDSKNGIYAAKYSVLFGKLRPYLAKSYYCEKDISCSSEFAVFPFDNENTSKYFLLLTQSYGFIDVINMSTYGTKMPRANINFINNLTIPLPPAADQKKIVEYLMKKIGKINLLIGNKSIKIDKLNDYKKSLIYEYVTGKKEVS